MMKCAFSSFHSAYEVANVQEMLGRGGGVVHERVVMTLKFTTTDFGLCS